MVNYSQLMVRAMMMMKNNSVMDPPPVELRNRLQDGISTGTEATAVELGFSLCVWSFWGYVGIYRRKRGTRGHRACPRGRGRALGRGARPPPSRATALSPDLVLKLRVRDFLQKYLSRRFHSV